LAALLAAGHEVSLVLTQPDRPSGRGLRLAESAVKQLARTHRLAIEQPRSLKNENALARLAAARPQALVVAAFGLLLPPGALEIAPHGALNIHASLLPRWRGAAPIQRALLAGDRETGISIMKMDAGLDTGPVLARRRLEIGSEDDARTLHDKLADLGAEMIVAALADVAAGRAKFSPQGDVGATYALKIGKGDAIMDWTRPCRELERRVRALRPAPGAQSWLRGEAIKLWRANCVQGKADPGKVLAADPRGITVACGEGALQVTELQRAGGRRLAAEEFLRGYALGPGEQLGAAR